MSLTDQMMASVLADAEPAAGFGGGHLGELFAAARCTTRVDGGSFSSYQKWHRLVQPTSRFAVSDGYGKFHAACAFLSNPTEDELGGFYTTDATGATRTMYCGYKANTSALPYRMQAKFKCEAPLFDADHPGGLSSRGGVKDVLLADECDEPNCLLCNQHYLACLDASVEEGRWAARDFSATWAASLHLAEADLRSYVIWQMLSHALPCPPMPSHAHPSPPMPSHALPSPPIPSHRLPSPPIPFHYDPPMPSHYDPPCLPIMTFPCLPMLPGTAWASSWAPSRRSCRC